MDKAATPLLWWRRTAATFVVAMNRVDVVELVVDMVDVDLDVGFVDVDLDVDLVDVDLGVDLLDVDLVDVHFEVDLGFEHQEYARTLSLDKCCRIH